jgi:diacylglycerol kinase (ATP)
VSTLHVLANPAARKGRGAAHYAKVLEALHAHGAPFRELNATSAADARAALRTVVAEPGARVVLVGGDGLVHLALQELATTDAVLGIIPAGSGNDFAHALGLDKGPLDAQITRALGDDHPLDAIRVGATWVASVATVGFAASVNARANALRWPRGGARYTIATFAVLPRLRAVPLTLELDGEPTAVVTTMLAIANTSYFGGGMEICPDARPDDGLLDIAVIGDVRPLTLLRVFPKVFRGTHTTHPKCSMYRAKRVRVLDTSTELWGDGELIGPAPITLEAVAGAFRVAGVSPPKGAK